jgi:hypothetical protein
MFNDEALIRILVKAELVRDETRAGADVEGAGGGRGGRPQSVVSQQPEVRGQRSENCRQARCGAVRCSLYGAQEACKGKAPPRLVVWAPVWVAASNEILLADRNLRTVWPRDRWGGVVRGAVTGLSLPGAPRARCGSWLAAALRCAALLSVVRRPQGE